MLHPFMLITSQLHNLPLMVSWTLALKMRKH